MLCDQCWADAYDLSVRDTSKSQAEHYADLVAARNAAWPSHAIARRLEEES